MGKRDNTFRKLFRKLKLFLTDKNKYNWTIINAHNQTTPNNKFDQSKVTVGKNTYGKLNVYTFGNSNEKLDIGNYVSIADNVTFLLGGNHPSSGISTYPFNVKIFGEETEATTKGPIIVEDDVWIGLNCLILSGVKINQGAVIAAGSVVVKDVPAYSIVGGNPAKIIKYRFEKEVISELLKLDFSKLDNKTLIKNRALLYESLNKDNIKSIIANFI